MYSYKILPVNNAQARKVLTEIRRLIAKAKKNKENPQLWILEHYTNCREQGFALSRYDFRDSKAVFSEDRNSDCIVVYTGTDFNFAFNTNIADEPTWAGRTYFDFNKHKDAARFIFDFLRK